MTFAFHKKPLQNHLFIFLLFFLTGFSGLIFYLFGKDSLEKIKKPGLLFALGTLGGTICFHLLPEYIEEHEGQIIFLLLAIPGFLIWFIPSLFKGKKEKNTHSIIALMAGDALHNAFTSVLWLSLCMASGKVEFMVVPAIMLHEIPHKAGNFGIMIFSGLKKSTSLILSILASLFFFTGLFIYQLDVEINGKILIPIIIGTLSYSFFSGIRHERHSLKQRRNIWWLVGGFFLMIFVNVLTAGWH